MQKLFDEVGSLDNRCCEKFLLSEEILMEHAAKGMANFIEEKFSKQSSILIVAGSGNNGADGIALARQLHKDYPLTLLLAKKSKSPMAKKQLQRAQSVGVKIQENITEIAEYDIIVDALVGTGFKGEFSKELSCVLKLVEDADAYKIACDIPSGIAKNGQVAKASPHVDITLTMGALKKSLYLDEAKEYVGKIRVVNLGISREIYETQSAWMLLENSDIKLPLRHKKDSHKGSYGHLALLGGDKTGAVEMSALSALKFGAGLVSIVSKTSSTSQNKMLMYRDSLPETTTALACGMGLGREYKREALEQFLENDFPLIVDADIFYMPTILQILKRKNLVITPHPKEFITLLQICKIVDISVKKLQQNRFYYAELFCKKYPKVVLLLKGANVIIGQNERFYINPYGTSALAKGGSGDVLSGLIGALLAQNYTPLDAAIHASLAHTQLAQNYTGADFSLTPDDLIVGIGNL